LQESQVKQVESPRARNERRLGVPFNFEGYWANSKHKRLYMLLCSINYQIGCVCHLKVLCAIVLFSWGWESFTEYVVPHPLFIPIFLRFL